MLALEVITGDLPYAKEEDTTLVYLIVQEQKPPEWPDPHISELVWSPLKACWNFTHPENRPSATQLRDQLEKLSQNTKITAETEHVVRRFFAV